MTSVEISVGDLPDAPSLPFLLIGLVAMSVIVIFLGMADVVEAGIIPVALIFGASLGIITHFVQTDQYESETQAAIVTAVENQVGGVLQVPAEDPLPEWDRVTNEVVLRMSETSAKCLLSPAEVTGNTATVLLSCDQGVLAATPSN